MNRFHEIEYTRPDFEAIKKELTELLAVMKGSSDYSSAKAAWMKRQEIVTSFRTAGTIARIHSNCNTADEFWEGEVRFYNTVTPELNVILKEFNEYVVSSAMRPEFEKDFGKQLFNLLDADIRTSDKSVVAEQIKEAELQAKYAKTAASCKTVFRGETCNFYGLLKHMQSLDREERKEAMMAWASLYENASADLDAEYAELCEVRRVMAEKLGFGSYIEMVYMLRHRFDYKAADIERFRGYVSKYIVPVAKKIHEAQRKRLGVEKLEYYDEALMFAGGNSTPDKDTQGMVDAAQQMYRELSKETGEFFDFMVDHDLFDLETRADKHLGGYCTRLGDYKAPFIFSNFNKTSADTEVLTHEAGHAFAGYTACRAQELMEYDHSTSEIQEIHSMGMEFFTDPWYNLFYPEGEGDRYRYEHLCSSLANITYLVSVDEFQHRVFEGEQPDAKGLRKIWHNIEETYLPWRSYDGNEFLTEGGFWMQKQHIFMYPFYYVDYALAMICALQFFLKMREDRTAAWADYMNLCRLGGSLGYFDLLKAANLKNPFEEETVKEVTEGVEAVIAELEKALV